MKETLVLLLTVVFLWLATTTSLAQEEDGTKVVIKRSVTPSKSSFRLKKRQVNYYNRDPYNQPRNNAPYQPLYNPPSYQTPGFTGGGEGGGGGSNRPFKSYMSNFFNPCPRPTDTRDSEGDCVDRTRGRNRNPYPYPTGQQYQPPYQQQNQGQFGANWNSQWGQQQQGQGGRPPVYSSLQNKGQMGQYGPNGGGQFNGQMGGGGFGGQFNGQQMGGGFGGNNGFMMTPPQGPAFQNQPFGQQQFGQQNQPPPAFGGPNLNQMGLINLPKYTTLDSGGPNNNGPAFQNQPFGQQRQYGPPPAFGGPNLNQMGQINLPKYTTLDSGGPNNNGPMFGGMQQQQMQMGMGRFPQMPFGPNGASGMGNMMGGLNLPKYTTLDS